MLRNLTAPVVLIVFNRPETTRLVFRAIAAARPQRLLLIADGPRASRKGEDILCREVRSIIEHVDWPCEVSTNFAESNLGCAERVVSGLNWAFSLVEEAIILEDDCLPHIDFFPFCQEMLTRYRGDRRFGSISATNLDPRNRRTDFSYHFSQIGGIWGWATWRAAWQRYDRDLLDWKAVERSGILREIWPNERSLRFWSGIFEEMHRQTEPNTWDYQWLYTKLVNGMLSIVPSVNMVRNIGFGPGATHTFGVPAWTRGLVESSIEFPLKHPPYVIPMRSFDELDQKIGFQPRSVSERIMRIVGRLRHHIGGSFPGRIVKARRVDNAGCNKIPS